MVRSLIEVVAIGSRETQFGPFATRASRLSLSYGEPKFTKKHMLSLRKKQAAPCRGKSRMEPHVQVPFLD
jgi:hypothetical protein